ncbi:MAG: hypothetical protein ACK6CU_24615 [Deltaproteobacteria bacterium]|jgi:hypothetical protein
MLESLANLLSLGDLLGALREDFGGYELVAHHAQGEFHHDVIVRVNEPRGLPSPWLVVSTNCNGGVKEVVATRAAPEPLGLWRWRCPDVSEFEGEAPEVLGSARTHHYFDPCELLTDDARSELREEFRERQPGGGWRMKRSGCRTSRP